MNYIVYDLEFNQNLTSSQEASVQEHVLQETPIQVSSTPEASVLKYDAPEASVLKYDLQETSVLKYDLQEAFVQDLSVQKNPAESEPGIKRMPFEILQIGALKLDEEFRTISSFDRLVKPTLFPTVAPFITELTGITTEQVINEATFPNVYQDFVSFIGESESVLCVWGKSDIKELYRNALYHELDYHLLPRTFINIQPFASLHLGVPRRKQLRLQSTVETLGIPLTHDFHNAWNDAYYTAEIFKTIYKPFMLPTVYDPQQTYVTRPKSPKMVMDFEQLLRQFEKMYCREMSEEEQGIIKLAYQMGKTRQFLKEI